MKEGKRIGYNHRMCYNCKRYKGGYHWDEDESKECKDPFNPETCSLKKLIPKQEKNKKITEWFK